MQERAFMYFPDHYRWSHGMLHAFGSARWGGAEVDELHRTGLRLRARVGDDQTWFAEWTATAHAVERAGRERAERGRRASAAAYLFRAANYFHIGERFLQPKTAPGLAAYRRGVECFHDAASMARRPCIEPVEIPYEGGALPALFVHAEGPADSANGGGRASPAVVFLDGFDITKEIQYFKGIADLAVRGIACLIVDGPGNGEAIRFRGLTLHHETERYATAAYEFLARREDVDPSRVGIMAISLGGYYAPRAAAYEPRFAACIAWGAQWDYHAVWKERLERLARGDAPALSVPWEHLLWIFGVRTPEEALRRLEGFRLDGVVQKIVCPFLLLHGQGDSQIPMATAQRCFNAVGSARKTFKVFTYEEGGYHHCQVDNMSVATAYMWDWLEDIFGPS